MEIHRSRLVTSFSLINDGRFHKEICNYLFNAEVKTCAKVGNILDKSSNISYRINGQFIKCHLLKSTAINCTEISFYHKISRDYDGGTRYKFITRINKRSLHLEIY
jgi:hypothetical protein